MLILRGEPVRPVTIAVSSHVSAARALPATRLPDGWRIWLLATIAAYAALMFLTRPLDYVDSLHYAKHIADQYHLQLVPRDNPFFDFGHVLWRPLVYLFWSPFREPLQAIFGGDDLLAITFVEIVVNVIGGLLGEVFLFLAIARTTKNATAAAVATIGYLSTNALLSYTQNGVAYGLGVAFQAAALYFLQYALSEGKFTFLWGAIAGAMLGLSIVTWFPYVLAAGGLFCYALFTTDSPEAPAWRARFAGLAGLIAGTVTVTLVVYGLVMVSAGFTSGEALTAWINRSRYDKQPDRGILRMLGGIPRSFVALGDLNVLLKRLIFEQRYFSPVALLATGVWKVLLVYAFFCATVLALWRSTWGRIHLVSLAAVALPLAVFAAFLFEGAPAERYMAAFPLLFLGVGHILANRQTATWASGFVGLFLLCVLGTNLVSMFRFTAGSEYNVARGRVGAINEHIQPEDRIILVSYRDEAYCLVNAEPFNPLSKNRYRYLIGLPWGTAHKELWRANFARIAQKTWSEGGRVWLSARFISPTPDPVWGWVEGDLLGIGWKDLYGFFSQFAVSNAFGGADGFTELVRTDGNERLLQSFIDGK